MYIYRPNGSCGKVMFSQVSVCSQGVGVSITCPRSLPEGGYAWSHVPCGVGEYVQARGAYFWG